MPEVRTRTHTKSAVGTVHLGAFALSFFLTCVLCTVNVHKAHKSSKAVESTRIYRVPAFAAEYFSTMLTYILYFPSYFTEQCTVHCSL